MIEAEDHWVLPLAGQAVTQCRFDYAFTIIAGKTESSFEIRIEEPFEFSSRGEGRAITVDPEAEPLTMGPALGVLHQTIDRAVAYKDGRLAVKFAEGDELWVPSGQSFEPWTLVGPAGLRIVSLPDGELAIWSPEGSGRPAS
jgi:hypothetical protein